MQLSCRPGRTHDAVQLRHSAAEIRSLLLQRHVEEVLQDVLVINSHEDLQVWILEDLQVWILEGLQIWILEELQVWILEELQVWILEKLQVWILDWGMEGDPE
ncbi:hypothetical protein EYF80_037676 [Liparis tanakae]|uniref:Uncharacterized protein n=1 Tax=Liparis tanakae TaxID=230148 RepID=A0A4Z2GF48_9TELE|nr:hypothetical protein EYF80_037676 [Liparis tanakae]